LADFLLRAYAAEAADNRGLRRLFDTPEAALWQLSRAASLQPTSVGCRQFHQRATELRELRFVNARL
jgi:hypothetical protein